MYLNLLRVLFLGIVAFASSTTAKAIGPIDLYAEPYLGYEIAGDLSPAEANSIDSYNGLGLGARLGVRLIDLVFVGTDFSYFPSLSYAPAASSALVGTSPNNWKLGLIGGVALPVIPLRFWLGFNFLDHLNTTVNLAAFGTPSAGTRPGNYSGNSFKIGAGYEIFPVLSLNAELLFTNYGSVSLGSGNSQVPPGGSISGKLLFFSVGLLL